MGIFLKMSRPEIYDFRVSLGNLFGLVISLWVIGISLGQPAPQANSAPIPRAKLLVMFQRELGNLYNPQNADDYLAAHETLEKYFLTSGDQRKAVAAALQVSGVDPNILGRLVHVRSDWPELTPGGVYYINEPPSARSMRTIFLGVPKNIRPYRRVAAGDQAPHRRRVRRHAKSQRR